MRVMWCLHYLAKGSMITAIDETSFDSTTSIIICWISGMSPNRNCQLTPSTALPISKTYLVPLWTTVSLLPERWKYTPLLWMVFRMQRKRSRSASYFWSVNRLRRKEYILLNWAVHLEQAVGSITLTINLRNSQWTRIETEENRV